MCWKHAYLQHHPAHQGSLLQLVPPSVLPSTSWLRPERTSESFQNSSPALSGHQTQELHIEDVDVVEEKWVDEHPWGQAIAFQRIRKQFWWSETHVPETWLVGAGSQSCYGMELARNSPKKKYQKCSKTHVHWWYLVFKLKIQKTAWDHVFVSLLDPLKCWRLEWWYFTQRKEPWCVSGKLSIHQGCFRKILVLQTWRSFNTNRKQIMNLNIFHFCQPWQDPMIYSTYSRVLMPVLIVTWDMLTTCCIITDHVGSW